MNHTVKVPTVEGFEPDPEMRTPREATLRRVFQEMYDGATSAQEETENA